MGGVSFGLYLVGGSLLGIALFRARVLSRWAAAMLVLGATSTLLVPLLPHAVGRYAAVPMGIALVGLGYPLWSEQREAATASQPDGGTALLDPAAAE
jgi:hypothetical protein